jgi:Ca2+-transporting ATPase
MHRNYEIEINEILLEHNVKPEHGLNTQQVIEQRKLFGVNELKQKKKQNIFVIILNELKDLMIIILLLAALLSFIMGILDFNNQDNITHSELYEGIVILFIVFLTVAIAVFQQVKTNSALEALKKISAPTSRVIRDGVTIVIPSSELVVGDIVYIEDGVIVPADIRLIEANNLSLQEASLTGESKSVKKHTQTIFGDNIPLGDQKNMCFSSSIVTYGSGVGVVIAVGMNTEVGKIANMINSQETNLTPLKKNLNKIGKILTYIGAIICLLIVVISCFFISGKDGG